MVSHAKKELPGWAQQRSPFGYICRDQCVYFVLSGFVVSWVAWAAWVIAEDGSITDSQQAVFYAFFSVSLCGVLVTAVRVAVNPNSTDRSSEDHKVVHSRGGELPWNLEQFLTIAAFFAVSCLFFGVICPVLSYNSGEAAFLGVFMIFYLVVFSTALSILSQDPSSPGQRPPEHPEVRELQTSAVMKLVYPSVAKDVSIGVTRWDLEKWMTSFGQGFSTEQQHERQIKAGKELNWLCQEESWWCRCEKVEAKWQVFTREASNKAFDAVQENEVISPQAWVNTAKLKAMADAAGKGDIAGANFACFPDAHDVARWISLQKCGDPFSNAKSAFEEADRASPWRQARAKQDAALLEFARDYELGNFCTYCKLWYKGQNRYHCHRCNKCTMGFDHHCPFLNQCICQQNYWVFYTLVLFFDFLMFTSCAASIYALVGVYGDDTSSSLCNNVDSLWPRWLFEMLVILLLVMSSLSMIPITLLCTFQSSMSVEMWRTGTFVSTLGRNKSLHHDLWARERVGQCFMQYVPWDGMSNSDAAKRALIHMRHSMRHDLPGLENETTARAIGMTTEAQTLQSPCEGSPSHTVGDTNISIEPEDCHIELSPIASPSYDQTLII